MMAAPLIAGNDLRAMSKETHEILTNREVLGVDQDSLGVQGYRYSTTDSIEFWVKPLVHGDWAVCFLNRSTAPQKIDFDWSKNIIADDLSKRTLNTNTTVYKIRDLWEKKFLGDTKKNISAELATHDVLVLRLIPQ